jgi:hypothetical protein
MSIPKNVLEQVVVLILVLQIQTILIQIGVLLFQRGNVPESVLFIRLNLIFLVGRSARTQPADISCKIFPSNSFFVLIRVGYGFGSGKMIRIQTDKAVKLTFFCTYAPIPYRLCSKYILSCTDNRQKSLEA